MKHDQRRFFTVAADLISVDEVIPYNLYINSSGDKNRFKYVRIYPAGEFLAEEDLKAFKKKYFQLYVHESQRKIYLESLIKSPCWGQFEKLEVIKGSAINYLEKIFNGEKELDSGLLRSLLEGCRDSVENIIELTKNCNVGDIQKLIGSLSFHDFYTFDHSINVCMYSMALLRSINFKTEKKELINLGIGGLLHDLGKIKISTSVINKADKLSEAEFNAIKEHPLLGGEILEDHLMSSLSIDVETIKRTITEHHENFDGTGYPFCYKGEGIHLYARIVSIADFFDALTTKRSYHKVLSPQNALEVMAKSVGKKIDPQLFEAFQETVNRIGTREKLTLELDETFDPCQPQNVLPFKKYKAKKQAENIFGQDKKENSRKKSA
ncbi:MAG: HD domain-containing phosphohydrolase [Bdellovibrionota bacterium]|nr:HD domain-containing phosphohydrolase [Bdellovibrionota bacterium]